MTHLRILEGLFIAEGKYEGDINENFEKVRKRFEDLCAAVGRAS